MNSSPEALQSRRERLRQTLQTRDLDAALVTGLTNVRYLTGLASSNAAVLVTTDGTDVLCTDARYAEMAATEAPGIELVVGRPVARLLADHAGRLGNKRVAYETHVLTVDDAASLAHCAIDWTSLGPAVEALRTEKDDTELALLRRACEITDAALDELRHSVRIGQTERELAWRLESRFRELGGDLAFETIVAGGPNSAIPHHVPTDRPLVRGDLLKVDCGARFGGYHADTTRTWVLGEPADWQVEIHALVRQAQQAGIDALHPGAGVRDVDSAARRVIADAGYGDAFGHGLGHGVGLEIHEAPMLSATSEGRLSARVPVTVEPGVYLPGRGGVRIEDVLLVRADDGPLPLTSTSRELMSVG